MQAKNDGVFNRETHERHEKRIYLKIKKNFVIFVVQMIFRRLPA